MTALIVESVERSSGLADDIDHLFCDCTPGIGLCGADITGETECRGDCEHEVCPSCGPLAEVRCIICGCGLEPECFECMAANQ